jgi:hypothetical protein
VTVGHIFIHFHPLLDNIAALPMPTTFTINQSWKLSYFQHDAQAVERNDLATVQTLVSVTDVPNATLGTINRIDDPSGCAPIHIAAAKGVYSLANQGRNFSAGGAGALECVCDVCGL